MLLIVFTRWMWDYPSLESELDQAGFKQVRKALLGDSTDEKFGQVERQERWTNCLGVEANITGGKHFSHVRFQE